MSIEGEQQRELEQIPFSLSAWAEDVLTFAGNQARSRGLSLASEIDPAIPDHLIGDPSRLKRVVSNLLDNAIRFTETGAVQLRIEQASIPTKDSSEVQFSVSDTGVGMAKDKLAEIFKGGPRNGSGPGLPTAKALVETMGGVIWAESLPGQGSTFHFRMVFRRVKENASA